MGHEIAVLAVPGVQLLDVSGPLDVFAEANRLMKRQIYLPKVIAFESETIASSSGVRVTADMTLGATSFYTPDTFLVAGAPGIEQVDPEPAAVAQIRALCERSRRFGSVCSGALLLARTGLLDGRRATTHWACVGTLAARYPQVKVDADALYIADGQVRTAAGVTSGLDLALRLVEEDLGRDVALELAAQLVMFFRRPVNQSHFSRAREVSLTGRTALQEVQRWTITHLDTVKTVAMMAAHLEMSERHLNRLFQQELGMTPRQWLERERVARVRQLLEAKNLPLKTLAQMSGFSCADVMRRVFFRVTGMTPSAYSRLTART